MLVKINGQHQKLENVDSLLDLITQKKLNPERIVIEHNSKIIDKNNLSRIKIKTNDTIEIVSFVGGG